jgi:ssDNA-binding Zn-finger/Zn-ribbon topoisomerase 1
MTREQAINYLYSSGFSEEQVNTIVTALEPTTTPIRPKGHWIDIKEISTNSRGQIIHEVICPECNGIAYFRSMGNKYIGANICPNCGADMREVEK